MKAVRFHGAGELALIIGAGGIGSFLTFAAASAGATVLVADTDARRLEIAAALGAARTIAVPQESVEDALDRAPDVIFEASGTAIGLEQSVRLAPRGGRIVAVGVQKAPPPVDMARVTLDELELIGTVAHVARTDFPEALRLLALREQGWADVAPEVLPLDLVVEAGIRPLAEGTSDRVKTLIDPQAAATRPSHTAQVV
jgi:(R,R)-butanediol dehydrogenase / meso-butanediol dehydrogenase / diacetyl reductase